MKLPPRMAFSIDSPGRSGDRRSVPGATRRTMLCGAPGRSTITRRGRAGKAGGAPAGGAGARLQSPKRRLEASRQRRLVEVAGHHQEGVARAVVDGVKGAHVVERQALERPLHPLRRQAVGVAIAEQQAVGDDVDDRFGLVPTLRTAVRRSPSTPLPVGSCRGAGASARPPAMLQRRRGSCRAATAPRAASRHVRSPATGRRRAARARRPAPGRRASPAPSSSISAVNEASPACSGGSDARAAADHQRRRDDRRDLAPHGDHLQPVARTNRLTGGAMTRGSGPDGRCRGHLGWGRAGVGVFCALTRSPLPAAFAGSGAFRHARPRRRRAPTRWWLAHSGRRRAPRRRDRRRCADSDSADRRGSAGSRGPCRSRPGGCCGRAPARPRSARRWRAGRSPRRRRADLGMSCPGLAVAPMWKTLP